MVYEVKYIMNVLILCTGNSCRSQMAEGFFRKRLKETYPDDEHHVFSAGTDPHGINPNAVEVMNEIGIDISSHNSEHLSIYINDRFDYIITVCDNAAENCPVFPGGGERMHWPFYDPALATGEKEEILNSFRKVRDQIDRKIVEWLNSSDK